MLAAVEYTTSGVGPYNITFHVPRANDLVVTLDGDPLTITTDWTVNSTNLQLTLVNTSTGQLLRIERVTSRLDADLPVDWVNGAAITASNMDEANHHLLHLIQEVQDATDDNQGADGADGQGFTWLGGWLIGTAYAPYDVVEFDGSSYVALQATTGDQPDVSPSDWDLVAEKGADGASGAGDESLIFMGL